MSPPSPAETLRLFVAVGLPESVRRVVERAVREVRDRLPAARWVPGEDLHLTLAFLGPTPREQVAVLAASLAPALGEVPPFPARVRGAGTFPPRRPARVAWLGLEEVPPAFPSDGATEGSRGGFRDLARVVRESLRETIGFEGEGRPFRPHVTVARCRQPWPRSAVERFAELLGTLRTEPFAVREAVLLESELRPAGARYRAVIRFPLGGEP